MVIKNRASFPNLDYTEMRKVCSAKPSQLMKKYGLVEQTTRLGKAWFKDNGADILAVAHLDSRQPFLHFDIARLKPDTLIFCPTLDDRLGAYVILDWLPKAGIKVDILLTENEEKGISTAGEFQFPKDKQYKWMFSFDRAGTDVVMYNYRNAIYEAMLEKHGWKVGYGSYSCIADLEDLGCKGFNFGVGYYNYHSQYAAASRNDLIQSLRKFVSFFGEYGNTEMPHEINTSVFARDRNQGHLSLYKYDQGEEVVYGDDVFGEKAAASFAKTAKKAAQNIAPVNPSKFISNKPKREDKPAENKDEMGKRAIASFLLQDIRLAGLSEETVKVLYINGVCLIAELVMLSRVEFLKLKGTTKLQLDEVQDKLKKFELGLSTILSDYNVDVKIITKMPEGSIRKEFTNLYTNSSVTTYQASEEDFKEPGVKMLPLERKVSVEPAIPESKKSEVPKPTEKGKGIENSNAEVVMISVTKHEDDHYKLIAEEGKLVWKEQVKIGLHPATSK